MAERTGVMVGVDEAGYGPLLGPYVLGVSFFSYRGEESVADAPAAFWPALSGAVSRSPRRNRIAVADSKALYPRKEGLRLLEEGVLSFLAARGVRPAGMRELLDAVGARSSDLDLYPWHRGKDISLPRATFKPLLEALAGRLVTAQAASPFSFLGLRARVLDAGAFNERLTRFRNKAEVGLSAIGEILVRLFRRSRSQEVLALVDRQGGRMHYARFLWRILEPARIFILAETAEAAAYRIEGKAGERMTVKFFTEGEAGALPIALASMLAKYVRELHMELLNAYFRLRVGSALRPTAGYYADGRRFLADIQPVLALREFPIELLVRSR